MSQYFRKYIKKQHYPLQPSNIKFKTAFRNCVHKALVNRQWRQIEADDWNLLWCQKEQIDWVFEKRVLPLSRVNHFRGWTQLCRKDMLSKNLKKFKRGLDKQGNNQESSQYDFLPPTYLMPSQYVIFQQQHKKYHQNQGKTLWIMKPTSKCQGRGIFIFNKISEISRWKTSTRQNMAQAYVCQRYIENPLLFGGRKFDMRIYALCTSYQPLTIYLYRSGFARFAHDRYQNVDLQNLYKHLTNVAINVNAPSYVKRIGGKWFLDNLKSFMLSKFGVEKTDQSFADIQRCIIKSMRAVQKVIPNSHYSFQLYGFDFLFDDLGKAWLLEVNGGPSMSANTPEDQQLKIGIIDDVMTVLNIEGVLKGDQEVIGGFDLIYKNKEITLPGSSTYSTMLGCKTNRIENNKKLARSCAYRLAKQFLQKQNAKLKVQAKQQSQQQKKFNMRQQNKNKTSNISNLNPTSNNNNNINIPTKKKIDNVNTQFIRYIEERSNQKYTQQTPKDQQEQE